MRPQFPRSVHGGPTAAQLGFELFQPDVVPGQDLSGQVSDGIPETVEVLWPDERNGYLEEAMGLLGQRNGRAGAAFAVPGSPVARKMDQEAPGGQAGVRERYRELDRSYLRTLRAACAICEVAVDCTLSSGTRNFEARFGLYGARSQLRRAISNDPEVNCSTVETRKRS